MKPGRAWNSGTSRRRGREIAIGGLVRLTVRVLFDFMKRRGQAAPVAPMALQIGARTVPLLMVRNPRARRYLLRVQPDGSARVTIPRGGNRTDAQSFVDRNLPWIERQIQQLQSHPRLPAAWTCGSEILFRGEAVRLEAVEPGNASTLRLKLGPEEFTAAAAENLRPAVERHLRALAAVELPPRVRELAARHQLTVQRITVRNQRRRWGSCSHGGNISLNWRLIQVPPFVSDYIILHELAHLRHMNHSARFWQEVARLCPDYRVAEKWFKTNRAFLR